jgi:hypothetical protein
MVFKGALSGNTIDFGAGADSATFSVALTNNTIEGGAGADTFVFNTSVSANYIYAGAGDDTLRFSAGVNNSSIVSADAGSDVLMFSSTVATVALSGGSGGDTITFTGAVSASTIEFGADNDMATFSGGISAETVIRGDAGADTLTFGNVAINATSIAGGAGADLFSGGISVGSSGVSFWGGTGNDTFDFTGGISNASGTAYFWNADAGTDSINLSNVAEVKTGLAFGVTEGSGLVINFGTNTDNFGTAAATSNIFTISGDAAAVGDNVATVAYHGTTSIFLSYETGATITMHGSGLVSEISSTFGGVEPITGATIAFGAGGTFPAFS